METDLGLLTGQVVLVGYGRVGRRIAASLTAAGIPFVVAEQQRDLVEVLRRDGIPAVSGDASVADVLVQAHVARASMLVIAATDTVDVPQMIHTAKLLNPGIAIAVRSANEAEAALLQETHAGTVFIAEQALASAMSQHVIDTVQARLPH